MDAQHITRCIGIPHLTLENYESAEPDSRYILTSPRSLEACERSGVKPLELLRIPVEEFYDQYKDKDYLSRSEILEEFHLQENVRLAKLKQAREERHRIIYLEAENEAANVPSYIRESEIRQTVSTPNLSKSKSPGKKRNVAWDSSVRGANIPLRDSSDTVIGRHSSGSIQKSWKESLRSNDSSPATSTPIKHSKSAENISVIGQRSAVKPRPQTALQKSKSYTAPARTPRKSKQQQIAQRNDKLLTALKKKVKKESAAVKTKGRAVGVRKSLSNENIASDYASLIQAHRDLATNVTSLESELKTLRIQQRRDEAYERKDVNVKTAELHRKTINATARANYCRNKLAQARTRRPSDHAVHQLRRMECDGRSHMLRETQAHISELKGEIKQYKTQRTARILQEERAAWEDIVTTRQSRALQRADVKARRAVRDRSSKTRQKRLERERLHAENMRALVNQEEQALLKKLDTIISKEKKADYITSEKERMVKKSREAALRSAAARSTVLSKRGRTFDKMSHQAQMIADLEQRGTAARWK